MAGSPDILSRYRRLVADLQNALARESAKSRTRPGDLIGHVRLVEDDGGLFAEYDARPDRLLLAVRAGVSISGCGDRIWTVPVLRRTGRVEREPVSPVLLGTVPVDRSGRVGGGVIPGTGRREEACHRWSAGGV